VSERTDAALVAATLEGDVDAFGALARRYGDSFARYAVQMLGDRDDADEALQLAFVRAYRNLASCREPERFAAWLHRIVVNECRRLAATRQNAARRTIGDATELEAIGVESPVEGAALREEIVLALSQLPAEQREAFLLKYVEELSYEEMAELTGTGVSALKMRVSRACERLRGLLQGAYQ
jgi:RNA polymerase sigma-70 factor, ECF subfamily